MNFLENFNAEFGDKYSLLQLKSVVAKKSDGELVITFLYPSTAKELTAEEKGEITQFFKDKLNLEQMEIRVKFMRVFLEEKLIMKVVQNFFETKYKIVTSYLSEKSFKVKITPIDVILQIELSPRMVTFFAENKVAAALAKTLKDNFLTDFVLELNENHEIDDEVDIVNVEMKTAFKPVQRYTVEIVKDVIGKGIMPKPEYLSFITAPKSSVIVAGFIKKIERKDIIIKNGKRAGQQKALFNFQIQDEKGKIDCSYFCSKSREKDMEALEEFMYILVHGDVKLNFMNKLCLYPDKIALASKVDNHFEEEAQQKKIKEFESVVEIEKMTALEQDSMFEQKRKYNNKIMNNAIVVFDIETTGLDPTSDEITEIGAVKLEDGNAVEKFSTFVKPTKKIPREVSELTGITNEMVENAPSIEYVIKDFYDFTRGCVICGHNAVDFDFKFIKREGDVLGLEFDNMIIDTLKEARGSRLKVSNYKLGTVCKALGISLEGAHRAWNDAFATAQVLLKLNEV
ncbi:MAG: ribonuclease H-like domain-containing protein [Clostridia bacterium]|nr:ribonuclease H-like domain-containing protein [Clostridia bacterium]